MRISSSVFRYATSALWIDRTVFAALSHNMESVFVFDIPIFLIVQALTSLWYFIYIFIDAMILPINTYIASVQTCYFLYIFIFIFSINMLTNGVYMTPTTFVMMYSIIMYVGLIRRRCRWGGTSPTFECSWSSTSRSLWAPSSRCWTRRSLCKRPRRRAWDAANSGAR